MTITSDKRINDHDALDTDVIQTMAFRQARDDYKAHYGIDFHADKNWAIGNDRWEFWLCAFEKRRLFLVINPL